MKALGIVLVILAALIILIVVWFVGSYNGFIRLRNAVEEAFSTMDVYLKKRFDLIPNLVETVKGCAKHESETLEKVIRARNIIAGAQSPGEKIQGEAMLQHSLKNLFAVAESYPDLRANSNFLDLQKQLNRVEEDIANSRKYYNAVVKKFNTRTEVFPGSLVAGIFDFSRMPLFEVGDAAERESARVQF